MGRVAYISGSSGFVGSYLRMMLPQIGIETYSIPRKILKGKSLKAFFKGKNADYIFHLASYGNLYDQKSDDETIETNIGGTYNLLEATKDISYSAFVNFSSSSVLLSHQTMYSATKLSSEAICQGFAQKYDKPIFSIRPSTIYGPGDNPAHLIPKVLHNLSTGDTMDIVPEPTHDYIFIEDLVRGVLGILEAANDYKGFSINISSGISTSNQEVINILEKITGKKLNINKVTGLRRYDTKDWKVDNSFMAGIGWKPEVSLVEGLKKTYVQQR